MCQLLLILIFVSLSYAAHYNGQFFDPRNWTYAECVPKQHFYPYSGSKTTTWNGSECVEWSKVQKELAQQMKGYYQHYFSTEYERHRECRTILLDQYERVPKVNNASAHSFVDFDGWRQGPWCYIKNLPNESLSILWFGKFNSPYRPSPCFPVCSDQKDPK